MGLKNIFTPRELKTQSSVQVLELKVQDLSGSVETDSATQQHKSNDSEHKKMKSKTTSSGFAERNEVIKKTAAYCLLKARGHHVRGCRTKAVRGKHKCHSSNGADKS